MAKNGKTAAETTESVDETKLPGGFEPVNGNLGDFNLADFESEQVGFAPYWECTQGAFFLGKIRGIDTRDPEFVRFMCEAVTPTACRRGSKTSDAYEEVTVQPGEAFTISVYYQLQGLFTECLESGTDPTLLVRALREVPTSKKGQTCWQFDVKIPKEDRKRLHAFRAQQAALQAKQDREERQFEASERKSINVEGRRTA